MVYQVYAERRKALFQKFQHPIVLFGGVDGGSGSCGDRNNFFYFTGIKQDGAICLISPDGSSTLYVPRYRQERLAWEGDLLVPSEERAQALSFDHIEFLGEETPRFSISLFDSAATWNTVLGVLRDWCQQGLHIGCYKHPLLLRFEQLLPTISPLLVSIDVEISRLRRRKTRDEIGLITRACDITALAHEAALYSILSESPNELTVRAAAEYLCTEHGSLLAFPSIVASGVHATTLHHQPVNHTIKSGELVVVDIGAKYEGYCADISRTYPVIGKFSERQRQLYEIVLSVQEAVAEAACPGMFLKNPDLPDKSLHHIACAVFKEYGLESAFIHNIGHYLGLDVHDVGSYAEPLAEGDVITIEPGVYLPNEGIGVRIEDNFWVVPGGAVCLSDSLVRSVDDIEALCSEILRS